MHALSTPSKQPVFLNSMLKARSVWPQTCLDLHYLDGGPHPVQSLQSVCPGMPPLTAILPWDNRELFGKGDKINTPSADYPPAILGPLAWLCVQSIKEPSVWREAKRGLIKHFGVPLFSVSCATISKKWNTKKNNREKSPPLEQKDFKPMHMWISIWVHWVFVQPRSSLGQLQTVSATRTAIIF